MTNGSTEMKSFLLIDEVYVKPGYQYSGSVLHGGAEYNPNEKAKTIRALMVNFLFGGPKFLFKIHPVHKIDSDFLKRRIFNVFKTTKGRIVDNNRVIQKCMKPMANHAETPYLMVRNENNHYLFKCTTHIMKCIRNNWITEPSKELDFQLLNETQISRAVVLCGRISQKVSRRIH